MSLPGRLAHLEEVLDCERRCPACQTRPRTGVRYENDWRGEAGLPEAPSVGRCPDCGWEPMVISVTYSDGWRAPESVESA